MKKYSWLNALENVSLVGLGAGSVASLLMKQVFYTTTPLSLLVVLGILNRRRFTQMSEQRDSRLAETDQYIGLQVDRLHHQVSSLPTPETVHRLQRSLLFKNQEISEKLNSEISTVKQGLLQRLNALEQQGLGSVQQEMRQLVDRSNYLMETVSQLGTDLGDLSTQVRADDIQTTVEQLKLDVAALQTNLDSFTYQTKPNIAVLQEHITRLDRQFSKLPPPVDLGSLKRQVTELIKIVGDLVPRRDLNSVVSEIQALHHQQETLKHSIIAIETAALNFRRTFNELPRSSVPDAESSADIGRPAETNGRAAGLAKAELTEQQIDLSRLSGTTPSSVYPELQELAANYLSNLRSQLSTIQEVTTHLAQQQKQLREQLHQLPQTLDVVALQRQLSELSQRVPASEGAIVGFKSRIQQVMQEELHYINQQLQIVAAAPQSELIFDFYPTSADPGEAIAGSRAVLEQALETTQTRLILVWPWSDQCQLDDVLFQKFETFLSQRCHLEIGWCYLADRTEERCLSKMQRGWMSDAVHRSRVQRSLHRLLQLKRLYPEQFQFKILGTSENFLVSDQTFAVLRIADPLKTTTPFSELQLKLKTADAGVIQRLIQRFDDPILEPEDLISHWNRAVTRCDLGDKAGAIMDYSQILKINPEDAITYNYRGLAHYDLEDWHSAIADFTESIRLNPSQAAAYCNLGFICAEQGNDWEAIRNYTSAAQASPNHPIAYFYRGITQQKLDDHLHAIEDFSEAIRLSPDSAVAYYYRGLAWQKLENLSEAIADFEAAAHFFRVRGSKMNAQKALKNLAKLRQAAIASQPTSSLVAEISEISSEVLSRS